MMSVDGTPCIYVFAVPNSDLLKVGSTVQARKRLYSLRWGWRPEYAPANCHQGDYAAIVSLPSEAKARQAERLCQALLGSFRIRRPTKKGRLQWQPEWFEVDVQSAVEALRSVADKFWPPTTKKGQMLLQFDAEVA